ncbi:MAG: 50S ribosomal protein L11 methyltransferase, partial [Kiritimatiellae bacterium]|nr:50S ribosomal protein L11 methyltransferase [Kiritimatiellia bacterium]
ILSGPLIEAASAIARTTAGLLILSGIRELEADAVAATYSNQGLEEVARDGDGEWAGIVMRRTTSLAS